MLQSLRLKILSVLSLLMLSSAAHAIADLTDFSQIDLMVPENRIDIFVAYAGKIGNICGVKVVSDVAGPTFSLATDLKFEERETVLTKPAVDSTAALNYKFATITPDHSTFGIPLAVSTVSGRPLQDVIREKLQIEGPAHVSLVGMPCKLLY